jgi:hypothetical protein
MKYERFWIVFVFVLMVMWTSCDNYEPITSHSRRPILGPFQILPEAPGLVGTFSGKVQNTDHTRTGNLKISITDYDRKTGHLTGTLTLTGFAECFTTGIFPDANHPNYSSHFAPGWGFIQASGTQPGSYSYLSFLNSNDFYKGLDLNGITEDLAFFDGRNWCLSIDPVLLKRE